jgi:hypothetical protein
MKKIIAFTFLLLPIMVYAQNEAAEDTTARAAITDAGKPTGRIAEMVMAKGGGKLVSGDGKLELIIPAGALSKKTTISIQPVSNTMPNGNGLSYRLEPSGIKFLQPVQLVFHYDPEESQDSLQLLMAIAMQDEEGQWYGLNKFTLDTLAKTISGNINHFSVWATYDKLKLRFNIPRTRIKVTRSYVMQICGMDSRTPTDKEHSQNGEEWEKKFQQKYGNDAMSPLSSWKPPQKAIWRVNRIIKGNAEFGILDKGIVDESKTEFNIYVAPRNVPDLNPVTISVDLIGASFMINGKKVKNLDLKTRVLIYDDAYEVAMISSTIGFAGPRAGKVAYSDTGSFVVSLNGKKTKLIEKINNNTTANLEYTNGACTITTEKPGAGSIHLVGGEIVIVTPATANQPAIVEIIFKRTPLILPLLKSDCPPIGKGDHIITTTAGVNAMMAEWSRAFPIKVKFEAKEGSQMIEQIGTEGSDLFFQVWVRKIGKGEDD